MNFLRRTAGEVRACRADNGSMARVYGEPQPDPWPWVRDTQPFFLAPRIFGWQRSEPSGSGRSGENSRLVPAEHGPTRRFATMFFPLLVLGLIAAVILWVIGLYNGLVGLR